MQEVAILRHPKLINNGATFLYTHIISLQGFRTEPGVSAARFRLKTAEWTKWSAGEY
jgi:hypothetical protein